MKTKLLLLLSVLCVALSALPVMGQLNAKISSAEPKTPKFLVVAISGFEATQATNVSTKFTSATFYGYKEWFIYQGPTTNSATAWLGFIDTAGGAGIGAGYQPMFQPIAAGGSTSLQQVGTKYDLKDIFFTGVDGDKILIVYTQ